MQQKKNAWAQNKHDGWHIFTATWNPIFQQKVLVMLMFNEVDFCFCISFFCRLDQNVFVKH